MNLDWIKLKIGSAMGATAAILADVFDIHWISLAGLLGGLLGDLIKTTLNGAAGALGGLLITLMAKYGAIGIAKLKTRMYGK